MHVYLAFTCYCSTIQHHEGNPPKIGEENKDHPWIICREAGNWKLSIKSWNWKWQLPRKKCITKVWSWNDAFPWIVWFPNTLAAGSQMGTPSIPWTITDEIALKIKREMTAPHEQVHIRREYEIETLLWCRWQLCCLGPPRNNKVVRVVQGLNIANGI